MDKKNSLIGLLLFGAAFALMYYQGLQFSTMEPVVDDAPEAASIGQAHPAHTSTLTQSSQSSIFEQASAALSTPALQATTQNPPGQLIALENDYIKVNFTTHGGAIDSVELKKYPKTLGASSPYTFNDISPLPALALGFTNANGYQEFAPDFIVRHTSEDSILFEATTPEGITIRRGYSLSLNENARDPYIIKHETRLDNNSSQSFNLKNLLVNMGAYQPTKGDSFGEYLNVGYFNGDDDDFIKVGEFSGSKGILGMGKRAAKDSISQSEPNLLWASVKNQFFASVLTPETPGSGVYAQKLNLGDLAEDPDLDTGMIGALEIQLPTIEPKQQHLLSMDFYVGPKEYKRLDAMDKQQDRVMQFGFFGAISKFLLLIMTTVNGFIPNWGLTIIVVTIFIKLLLWPLTAIQARSSKRMAKIQEPLKALKEKHKDNPQKMQMETMKLFKENRVNPAAGCLPLFVQLPIFLGLYFMLRTSSELRFADFLWISDLSVPDTIAYIAGFPLNILPLCMAFSMFFQMKVSPTPMTDNTQKKIFQLMPFIFLIFCYNFPSGLVLYWTMQNLLTILQQQITNRMKDPADDLPPVTPSGKANKKSSKKRK